MVMIPCAELKTAAALTLDKRVSYHGYVAGQKCVQSKHHSAMRDHSISRRTESEGNSRNSSSNRYWNTFHYKPILGCNRQQYVIRSTMRDTRRSSFADESLR